MFFSLKLEDGHGRVVGDEKLEALVQPGDRVSGDRSDNRHCSERWCRSLKINNLNLILKLGVDVVKLLIEVTCQAELEPDLVVAAVTSEIVCGESCQRT